MEGGWKENEGRMAGGNGGGWREDGGRPEGRWREAGRKLEEGQREVRGTLEVGIFVGLALRRGGDPGSTRRRARA